MILPDRGVLTAHLFVTMYSFESIFYASQELGVALQLEMASGQHLYIASITYIQQI